MEGIFPRVTGLKIRILFRITIILKGIDQRGKECMIKPPTLEPSRNIWKVIEAPRWDGIPTEFLRPGE
jgi:hypothetical protein